MTTAVLVVLTIVLIGAACYVGMLLLRRARAEQPDRAPRTVGDLVRRRTDPAPGELPVDASPVTTEAPDDARVESEIAPAATPSRPAVARVGEAEAGDAPWRRAARMMGSEPGGAWETAPVPLVAAPDGAAVVLAPPPLRADADRPASPVAPTPSGSSVAPSTGDDADVPAAKNDAPSDPATAEPPVDALVPPSDVDRDQAGTPSRPLSDPDLTPLMGIPIVRPTAAAPPPACAVADVPDPVPAPPPSRLRPFPRSDDEVVVMVPATPPAERPAVVTGSPQPVWFRVVRRDGEPVDDALVALLDDRGQEADATKTVADGGGELRAPHSGRFLMIASAEGFQPRAVTLEVDERPVEIALLLPRSATVAGVVREGGTTVAGAYVVALQEGEIADEIVTDRDGGYRFDDLAEGVYALCAFDGRLPVGLRSSVAGAPYDARPPFASATSADGGTTEPVTLSEGADLCLDLELTPSDAAER